MNNTTAIVMIRKLHRAVVDLYLDVVDADDEDENNNEAIVDDGRVCDRR